MGFTNFIIENFNEFLTYTGFANVTAGNFIMIAVGAFFIWLAIKKDFEPLLLVPIGLGIILGNIPFRADAGLEIGLYEDNSVLNIFYQGVRQGWYPPLIFLGIGAMTDFSALLANPKLMLIGAAAQFGIFGAYMFALALGFEPNQAAGIAIIGGACRWSYSHIPEQQTLAQPDGSHRRVRIFVYGLSTADSATIDAPAHHQEGARHQDEACSRSQSDRAHTIPNSGLVAYNIHSTLRTSPLRHAVLRQPTEGEWQDHSSGQDRRSSTQRYRGNAAGTHRRMLYSGIRVPYHEHYIHLRHRSMCIHRGYHEWSTVR